MDDWERFDKFTDRAKAALRLAEEEAKNLSGKSIGPEYLLLGLIAEGGGIAAKVLQHLGVGLNEVRSIIASLTAPGNGMVLKKLELTLDAQKVIEMALDEAQQLNHSYVGPEHLLLGLIRKGEASVIHIFEHLDTSPNEVRTLVIQILDGFPLQKYDSRNSSLPSIQGSQVDPWATAEQRYVANQEIVGTITKIVPFGAFVHIEDGIEGLLHLSELTPEMNLRRDLHDGQQLRLRILRVDGNRHRFGLTLR